MIIGIHHVQITIPKGMEQAARLFYCEVLNLPEIEKPASLQGRGGFWVQVGDREVHIGSEDGVERNLTKAHIGYEVSDLTAIQNILIKQGITIVECVPIPGYERFEFRDPFDNRVECIQRLV
ncbi:MAG: VOC family protein [Candidatus Pristimantibacillus lignocellulolyticus]|uniref:VOC family protein n=1 Tax=Candidatus Pristimantibacillus lignocellulolyticus TaxID=2994561 RepID=A0A9J6ZC96_9BACL|nr:MAG: VOC family protein [Candidatus Pristimantibacillus lignocellulolyticus]